jgi:hypothetical protein
MIKVKIKKMGILWKIYLYIWALLIRSNTIIGFTTFWNSIIIREGYENNQSLILHELTHIKQIHDEGLLKFTFKYVINLFKYGYRNNPYEVEARANSKTDGIEFLKNFNIINEFKE